MKNVAVILSGCGVFDGAEIHEAVLTLLAIEQNGAAWQCYAPDIDQHHVVNHITGEEMEQTRNVMVEAARIARGAIHNLAQLDASQYDALIVPGGFGVAKNLSDFAFKGAECAIHTDFIRAGKAFAAAGKPAGYLCIAPALLPLIYGEGIELTIGCDADTEAAIEALGGAHKECSVDDVVVDEANKLVTTPAYMLAQNVSEAAEGINQLVKKVLSL